MKKLFAAIMAVVMMMSLLCVNAFATSLTISEPEGMKDATYAGYMILNATNDATDTSKFAYTLNDKYADILKTVTKKTTEKDIVEYIAGLDASGMRSFANDVYAAIAKAKLPADATLKTGKNDVDEGYWLIAQISEAAEGETASLVMVDTAGKDSLVIESKKAGVPLTKEVTDESQLTCKSTDPNHKHTAACYDWSKTNESPIGATVNYRIDTQVPAAMASYKFNAFFIVGDTMGKGLTLNADSIKAFVKGDDDTYSDLPADAYTVRTKTTSPTCESGYDFQLALVNPKAFAGKDIMITYSAVVNENAELTLKGNPNEAQVTYNPDDDVKYGGEPGSNGFPTEEQTNPSGKSPKDFTITYVTGVKFLKIDGTTKKPLTGAQFTITGTTESTVLKWKQEYVLAGEGEIPVYYKLTDGKYTSQAPVTADYMEEVQSDEYVGGYVKAAADDEATATDVTISGVRYRVSTEDDFGVNTIYTLVKANVSAYAETTAKYVLKEGWIAQTSTKDYKTVVDVDENGIAKLPGLAAGTYHVTESVVPAGYNKIDDFDIVVTWQGPNAEALAKDGKAARCTWTAKVGDTTLVLDETDTTLFALTVENNAGAELPSTGGIGTYIFYAVGGLLLVGAAVMLVAKKRMDSEN